MTDSNSEPPASLADQAANWVVRLSSGDLSQSELAAFKSWLAESPDRRAAFDRERALWQALDGHEHAFRPETHAPHRPRPARRTIAFRIAGAAVAASIALLIAPEASLRLRADYRAPVGQTLTARLPDGSTAVLDSGAAIDVTFNDQRRAIEILRGRVWFEVRHGEARPFRVTALGGVTEDVGTAFEVRRESGHVTVGVTEGVVQVAAEDGSTLTLGQFERAAYDRDGPAERLPGGGAHSLAPWRRNLLVVDNATLKDAVAEIGRYRQGQVLLLGDVGDVARVSGVFRIDAPDDALAALAQMADLRLLHLPGGLILLMR